MQEVNRAGRRIRRALACAAAGLMLATAVAVSGPAEAARGVGFGGGGFHGESGGFHGGGFHGGFHSGGLAMGRGIRGGSVGRGFAGLHHGFATGHGEHWVHGRHNGRYGWGSGDGLGWSYYTDPDGWDYGDDSLPSASAYWYCSDPSGYYPYVRQCNTAWQTTPGS